MYYFKNIFYLCAVFFKKNTVAFYYYSCHQNLINSKISRISLDARVLRACLFGMRYYQNLDGG